MIIYWLMNPIEEKQTSIGANYLIMVTEPLNLPASERVSSK
jgi:hypothetical protein